MADIFYFTSPRKASTVARYRPSARRTPKVVRKRRATNAEMFDQRACMAQYEEPTFCPSDDAISLFLSRPVHATARDTPSAFDPEHDYDMDDTDDNDDQQESGGVPLPPSQRPHMPHDHDNVHMNSPILTTHDQDTHLHMHDDADRSHGTTVPSTTLSPTLSRPRPRSHARPQTRESNAEESSRRTRFALAGDSMNEEPQFDEAPSSFSHSLPSHRDETPASTSAPRWSPLQLMPQPSIFQNSHHATARELENAILVRNIQHTHIMDIDEDALAVDDPRRHYDVADFMDTWRLHSIANKQLPPFEPGIQSSIRLGRPPEQVTREQAESGNVDMQGTRWHMIGPSQECAHVARAMLHPSSAGSNYSRSSQYDRPWSSAGHVDSPYRFRAFVPRHRASFEHYQLRNVLAATDRNNVFYVSTGNRVMRASLACPTSQETAMNLSKPSNTAAGFRITCLSASSRSMAPGSVTDNVLIAGGFHGEYAVLNVEGEQRQPSEGFVTHAYNGLVTHVHNYQDRRSGLLRAAFCSNDHQVRLMDLHKLTFTNTFHYDHAINCAATSTDGRLRVLVGDSTDTMITDADRGVPLVTLREHTDHAFGCAWSPNGRHVATAAQDGGLVVWDARSWKQSLCRFESSMSCARSLHFTDNGALVAAENEDIVTIYDGPSFGHKQEIRFFGSIAGVTLLDGGAELAVANADKTLGGLLTFERRFPGQTLGEDHYDRPVPATYLGARRRSGRLSDFSGILV